MLEYLGRRFGIKSLEDLGHPSRYVELDSLRPEYAPRVRELFYPKNYSDPTYKMGNLRILKKLIDKAEEQRPSQRRFFWDEYSNTLEPVADATIDHKRRVVENWNSDGGNNSRQDAREKFFNEEEKLRIIARRNNSSDGAEARRQGLKYEPKVGRDFRGPDDEV